MNPLELYAAFCEAQAVSINAQLAHGCKVVLIEDGVHKLYEDAMAFERPGIGGALIEAVKTTAEKFAGFHKLCFAPEEEVTLAALRRKKRDAMLAAGSRIECMALFAIEQEPAARDMPGFRGVYQYGTISQVHPNEIGSCEDVRIVVLDGAQEGIGGA